MRVSTLADELGIDPKVIRRFLRSRYDQVGTGGRWDLNSQQIEQVKWRFEGEGRKPSRITGGTRVPPLVRRYAGPGIADRARQLQAEPQDIHIKVVGSPEDLIFHKIVSCWHGRRHSSTVALLSNGEFKEGKDLPGISHYLLETQYCLIKREEQYYIHHLNYVNALSEISIPHWLVTNLINRPNTGRDDTPQELLINDYARTFDSKLHTTAILKWEHETGKSILAIPLKELWDSKFKPDIRVSRYSSDFHLTLSRYFATINLLQEQPQHSEAFNVTIGDLFRRFHVEVGQRAENLRRDVAQTWGFEEYGDNGWRKRKGGDEVVISSDLRVHINRRFICIVSAKSSQLPHDDEVARRMLAVATAHRDQIYTIRGEVKEALERLFPIRNGIT